MTTVWLAVTVELYIVHVFFQCYFCFISAHSTPLEKLFEKTKIGLGYHLIVYEILCGYSCFISFLVPCFFIVSMTFTYSFINRYYEVASKVISILSFIAYINDINFKIILLMNAYILWF